MGFLRMLILLGCGLFSTPVSAVWWSGNDNVVYDELTSLELPGAGCSGANSLITFDRREYRRACVYGDSNFRIAVYNTDGGLSTAAAYRVSDTYTKIPQCQRATVCAYSRAEDALYELVAGALHRHTQFSQQVLTGEWTSDPYMISASTKLTYFALSQDGHWLVAKDATGVLYRVDLQIGEATALHGVDGGGSLELSISNNGETLAAIRADGMVVFVPFAYCHSFPSDDRSLWCDPSHFCVCDLDFELSSVYARFSDDGGRYIYDSPAEGGVTRSVILETNSYRQSLPLIPVDYVALGDSFSSGEGELDDAYYLPQTNDANGLCHVSSRSYPFLLSAAWQMSMQSVACSGAKMTHILERPQYTTKQGTLAPGASLQIEAVRQSRPQLVTVGIGGNDAGFMDKLKACVTPGTCVWASDPDFRAATAKELQSLYGRYVDLFHRLRDAAPFGRVFAVGYPFIMSQDGTCRSYVGLAFTKEERRYVHEAIFYLNTIIESAAKKSGVGYFDIAHAFRGDELCSRAQEKAMNAFRLGDDIAPLEALSNIKLIGAESFHPTPFGHERTATHILRDYPHESDVLTCLNCVDAGYGTVPDAPPYWGALERVAEASSQRAVTLSADEINTEEPLSIVVDKASFIPRSLVEVYLYSDPLKLWQGYADEDGGLRVTLTLPPAITSGIHTLSVSGDSFGNQTTRLYQSITVIARHNQNQLEPSRVHPTNQGLRDVRGIEISTAQLGEVLGRDILHQLNMIKEGASGMWFSVYGILGIIYAIIRHRFRE